LPKNKSTSKSSKKRTSVAPKKQTSAKSTKMTPAQRKRLQTILAKMPPIEKLDPEMYAKLQSTIHDVIEKTVPEYQQWVGKNIVAEECPTPLCSSCGNDCPTPLCSSCGNDCPTPMCDSCGNNCPTPVKTKNIDEIVTSAVNQAMTKAIRQALKEQFK
jgi:septum formation topological specificity factor MinE